MLAREPGSSNLESLRCAVLLGLGRAANQAREFKAAFPILDQAARWCDLAADSAMKARVDSALGVAYLYDQQPAQAAQVLERSVRIFQSLPVPDPAESSRAISNLASANWMLGNLEEAAQAYRQVIDIKRAAGDRNGEYFAHSGLGNSSLSMGDYQTAIEQYRLALSLARSLANQREEAQSLNSLGYAAFLLGTNREALDHYRDALNLWRKIPDRRGESMTLNNIGWLYRGDRDWSAAREVYLQAIKAATETGGERERSYILHGLGEVRAGLGDLNGALAAFDESLAIKRKLGDRHGEAFTLAQQAEVVLKLGDLSRARSLADHSLSMRRDIADRSGQAASLGVLARIQRASGEALAAASSIEQAVSIIEGQRSSIASIENRATFFATSQDYYLFWIGLLLDSARPDPARALEVNERRLARSLRDRLWEDRNEWRDSAPPELVASLRTLDRRIEGQSQRLQTLASQPANPAQFEAARKTLSGLLSEREALESKFRAPFPVSTLKTSAPPWSAGQFQRSLPPGSAAVAFQSGSGGGHVWWIDRNRLLIREIPSEQVISSSAEALARAVGEQSRIVPAESYEQRTSRLRRARAEFSSALRALSKDLLSGLPLTPETRRLIIVADGAAAQTPFSALLNPVTNRPLIESAELVLEPSLSWRSGNPPAPAPSPGYRLLIVADPAYDPNQTRWPPLPFAGSEAKFIATAAPNRARLLTGPGANLDNLRREPLNSFSLIHFAVHAGVDLDRPALSGIVLAPSSILRLYEIATLDLNARLVVLSACRTAAGANLPGEGVLGLARAFLSAGARQVVATSWQVPDRSTSELMKLFYDGLLRRNLRPEAALRAAQLKLRAQPLWSNPFYWSAFSVYGGGS